MLNAEKARKASERAQERKLFAKAETYIRKAMKRGWKGVSIPETLGEQLTECSLLKERGFTLLFPSVKAEDMEHRVEPYRINW